MTQEKRTCQSCKQSFVIEVEDFEFYQKVQVPVPTFCPECRLVRRLCWRNERTFYRRVCEKCQKSVISVFSPEGLVRVYCSSCWWSGDWDGLDFPADFDFGTSLMLQVKELFNRVPIMNLYGLYTTTVGSDYTNAVSYLKNCYLVTHSDHDENCYYGSQVTNSRDCVDSMLVDRSELCYECVNCINCYNARYSVDCEGSRDILFCRDCRGCSDCFGCVGLRSKKYCIFNKQHSREEYFMLLQRDFSMEHHERIHEVFHRARQFWLTMPVKFMHGEHNNQVSGDYVYHSKNTFDSFMTFDSEDGRYLSYVTPGGITDSYDFTHYGAGSEFLYESIQSGDQASRILFSWWVCTNVRNVEYSMFCTGCSDCFACVGLKKRQYCILNRQYTKDEYMLLRSRIVAQMEEKPYVDQLGRVYGYGEFFPSELSPFGYNETTAFEQFPMEREKALEAGYVWREREVQRYQVTRKAFELPGKITEAGDDILKDIVECENARLGEVGCSGAFRIVPQELEFYRRMNLPLPRLCSYCRYMRRVRLRNPLHLWDRSCDCRGADLWKLQNSVIHFHGESICPSGFRSSYSFTQQEVVYCEQCYQAEVA